MRIYVWTKASVNSRWVCLHIPLAGHEGLQQRCLLWFVWGSRSQSIQRPRIHHHVVFSRLLQMKRASNFESDFIHSNSKQAKVKLKFYFLVMSLRPSFLRQWMQWIEQLASPSHSLGHLSHSRRHLRVNKKAPRSRRSTRQEEHCSESRLCSVIACNHIQLASFSCREVIPWFDLFLDQRPFCGLHTRF